MSLKAQRMTDMALTVRDLDHMAMTPAERRAIREAYGDLVKHWTKVKQHRYDAAVASRNALSRQITKGELAEKVREIRRAVKAGTITADEGRKVFRDLLADHQRLLGVVKALAQMDDELEQFDATTAAEVQADMINKYPALKQITPTLEDLAGRKLAEQTRKSWALPGDMNYDAPSAEDIGIEPPNARRGDPVEANARQLLGEVAVEGFVVLWQIARDPEVDGKTRKDAAHLFRAYIRKAVDDLDEAAVVAMAQTIVRGCERARKPRDPDTLSVRNTRRRLSRNAKTSKVRTERDVAMLVKAGLYKPVAEWDLEELAHGKPRAKDGSFRGVRPSWIDASVQGEITRRLREGLMSKLQEHAPMAIAALAQVANNPDAKDRDRNEAALGILGYVLGKPAVNIEVGVRPKYEQMLADVIVLDDGTESDPWITKELRGSQVHPVVDGKFWEEDADDEY